jgi:hypothetical protein
MLALSFECHALKKKKNLCRGFPFHIFTSIAHFHSPIHYSLERSYQIAISISNCRNCSSSSDRGSAFGAAGMLAAIGFAATLPAGDATGDASGGATLVSRLESFSLRSSCSSASSSASKSSSSRERIANGLRDGLRDFSSDVHLLLNLGHGVVDLVDRHVFVQLLHRVRTGAHRIHRFQIHVGRFDGHHLLVKRHARTAQPLNLCLVCLFALQTHQSAATVL